MKYVYGFENYIFQEPLKLIKYISAPFKTAREV